MMLYVLIVLMIPVSIVVNGLLLRLFWGWFVVPLGLAPIGIAHALGISVLVAMLTYEYTREPEDGRSTKEVVSSALLRAVVRPLVLLAMGSIYHACM
jgi:hypothetical protein